MTTGHIIAGLIGMGLYLLGAVMGYRAGVADEQKRQRFARTLRRFREGER